MIHLEVSNVAKLPTKYGIFNAKVFKEKNKEHLVLFTDTIPQNPLVRIHSECLTGDVFGSLKCDCGDELAISSEKIAKEGGLIVYLRQEGRDIGLLNKINAYALQDKGYDTVEANLALGFKEDERSYESAKEILKSFGLKSFRLLTNNPLKVLELEDAFEVERVSIQTAANCYNESYLKTKKEKMGHLLEKV